MNAPISNTNTAAPVPTPAAPAPTKKTPVKVAIKMDDGRTVEMKETSKYVYSINVDPDKKSVEILVDFANGKSLKFSPAGEVALRATGYGAWHKAREATNTEQTVEDVYEAMRNVFERFDKGQWEVERTTSESFAGSGVVLRAIAEVRKTTVDDARAFVDKLLASAEAAAAAAGTKPTTRQALYKAFRVQEPTASIIRRLEAESGATKSVDVSALLAS